MRKQFLLTGGKIIYGFDTKGEKFVNCLNMAEITDLITCKVKILFLHIVMGYISALAWTERRVSQRVQHTPWTSSWKGFYG